jgi:hypothetical protein
LDYRDEQRSIWVSVILFNMWYDNKVQVILIYEEYEYTGCTKLTRVELVDIVVPVSVERDGPTRGGESELSKGGFTGGTVLPVSVERVGTRRGGESELSKERFTGGVMDLMPKIQVLNTSTLKAFICTVF